MADDVYLMSDRQTKLQAQLEIASHYGKMYRIKYGAAKTKVTVVGSEIDQNYFSDVKPWIMDNEVVQVVTDNEHLGQIVSGTNQEVKNVDLRLEKERKFSGARVCRVTFFKFPHFPVKIGLFWG